MQMYIKFLYTSKIYVYQNKEFIGNILINLNLVFI